jgi:hypothetical protein
MSKADFLSGLKENIKDAEEYIMVGNVYGETGWSDDRGADQQAGWRFILERDFAAGAR